MDIKELKDTIDISTVSRRSIDAIRRFLPELETDEQVVRYALCFVILSRNPDMEIQRIHDSAMCLAIRDAADVEEEMIKNNPNSFIAQATDKDE